MAAQRKFDKPFDTPDRPVIYNTGREGLIVNLVCYDNYGNTGNTNLSTNDRKVLPGIEYVKKTGGTLTISNSAYRATYTYQVSRSVIRTANLITGNLGVSSVTNAGGVIATETKEEALFTPATQIPEGQYHSLIRLNLYLTMSIPYV